MERKPPVVVVSTRDVLLPYLLVFACCARHGGMSASLTDPPETIPCPACRVELTVRVTGRSAIARGWSRSVRVTFEQKHKERCKKAARSAAATRARFSTKPKGSR